MSAPIDELPAHDRVKILSGRLKNLKAGAGDYRRSRRTRAIQNCAKWLAEAKADMALMVN